MYTHVPNRMFFSPRIGLKNFCGKGLRVKNRSTFIWKMIYWNWNKKFSFGCKLKKKTEKKKIVCLIVREAMLPLLLIMPHHWHAHKKQTQTYTYMYVNIHERN